MLEILILIGLTNIIGKIVEAKGYRSGKYKWTTVGLWVGGEIVGAFIGTLLTGGRESAIWVYVIALAGAAAGAWIAYSIANNLSSINTNSAAPSESIPTEAMADKPGSVVRAILWSVAGFGVGSAIASGIHLTLYGVLKQWMITDSDIVLYMSMLQTITYIVIGSVGGAGLGLAKGSKNKIFSWVLAGFIGCSMGYLIPPLIGFRKVLSSVFDLGASIFGNDGGVIFLGVAQDMMVGIFAGIAFGIVLKNWKQGLWLALAGAVGFVFYGLWDYSTFQSLLEGEWYFTLLSYIRSEMVINGFRGLIGGAIIGLCFGLTMKWNGLFSKNSPQSQQT
jgi:hypothetical protein